MYRFCTVSFICFYERCKFFDVIFRFQEDIFSAVFPFLQKIGRIEIDRPFFCIKTGMLPPLIFKRSIKRYEYYPHTL